MAISKEEFDLFRKFIKEKCGITLVEGKEYLVENRLTVLMIQSGAETFTELYKLVISDNTLAAKVIEAIVTNETLWFRDNSFFELLNGKVVPWLVDKAKRSKVRIWSVASSTGQEAYSVGILVNEACIAAGNPALKNKFEVIGTDISPSAIFMAISGRYSQLAMSRGMRKEYLEKYFKKDGAAYELDESIRSMVQFKKMNLLDNLIGLGSFDFVMCRNVLIYFSDEIKRDIYSKLHKNMNNSAVLVIGATESSAAYTDDFTQRSIGGSVLYTPKGSTQSVGLETSIG